MSRFNLGWIVASRISANRDIFFLFNFLSLLFQKQFLELSNLFPYIPQTFIGNINGGLQSASWIMGWIVNPALYLNPSNISFNGFYSLDSFLCKSVLLSSSSPLYFSCTNYGLNWAYLLHKVVPGKTVICFIPVYFYFCKHA